jgi:segregation and condensation protein B
MDENQIKYFVEAALLAAGRPLSVDQIQNLFDTDSAPEKSQIRDAIGALMDDYEERGLTVKEVASGFRIQVEAGMAARLGKLWEERPPRYSRALFETLALIAYRQPMTRGEIEEIRGVSVSPNIIRSLMERDWVRVVGHRDVPGRPEMFGTTRQFLDYFGLRKLDDLPPLADLADWESLRIQLNLPAVDEDGAVVEPAAQDGSRQAEEVSGSDGADAAAAASDIPALEPDGRSDASAAADSGPAESGEESAPEDQGIEPIEATAWPDPGNMVVKVVDAEADNEDEDREDASLTGG